MGNLMKFEKEDFGAVRVVMQEEDPWFIASDVAKALGYDRPRDAVAQHCKKINKYSYGESQQPYNIIPESDVYRLIMRSNLPNAEKFQDWVCEEVLPSIRKTGSYSVQQMTPGEFLLEQAKRFVEIEKKTQRALDLSLLTSEKMEKTEVKIESVENRLNQIETAHDHFTIMGYCSLNKIKLPLSVASRYGKEAAIYCKENNIEMGIVPDPRFGKVNTYPLYVLQQIIEE